MEKTLITKTDKLSCKEVFQAIASIIIAIIGLPIVIIVLFVFYHTFKLINKTGDLVSEEETSGYDAK